MRNKIELGDEFTVSKTDNRFIEVTFNFSDGAVWKGCFPLYYPWRGIQYQLEEDQERLKKDLREAFDQLQPENIAQSLDSTESRWAGKKNSATFAVFKALVTGRWECRSCGVGKINDQAAARIRAIKQRGFVVATRKMNCCRCKKRVVHDILLPFEIASVIKSVFRKTISDSARAKIIKVLLGKDAFFSTTRPHNQFVIDHKFPSQRWTEEETDNENLNAEQIKQKFQLLTNQSNMLKSRLCDKCCSTGQRPDFLGIKWFYSGDGSWNESEEIGSGCYGCPWYDLEEWKRQLTEKVSD